MKHFRAHLSPIQQLAVNVTGSLLATVASDKAVKVFDVINFDMINILQLDYVPAAAAWIHRAGAAVPELAVADTATPTIHVYDGRGTSAPLRSLEKIHMKPVRLMLYSPTYDVIISCDEGAMIEYWSGFANDYGFPKCVREVRALSIFRQGAIRYGTVNWVRCLTYLPTGTFNLI